MNPFLLILAKLAKIKSIAKTAMILYGKVMNKKLSLCRFYFEVC